MAVHEEERRKDLADVKTMMDTAHGRRIVYRVLKSSGCLDRPAAMTEPALISYTEGQRSIGFDLFADVMEVAPKKFMVMILEAKERAELVRALQEKEREGMDE